MKQKILYITFVLILLTLTLITYNEGIKFQLLINSSIPTEKVSLSERNNGFQGARISSISENPKNPMELIAKGTAGNYYTNDKGSSWRLLEIDDQKYVGGKGQYAPNVYWDKNGRLITGLGNGIEWSNNTIDWKRKWLNYNVYKLGITNDGTFWIERGVKGQDQNVFEYIYWDNNGLPYTKVISDYYEIQRIQREDSIYLNTPPKLWKIENHLIFNRKDLNSEWVPKNKGIERPVILYFLQDIENPKEIIAVEGDNVLYSQSHFNPRLKYWFSNDFGLNWSPKDSSSIVNLKFKKIDGFKSNCSLTVSQHNGYLNNLELKNNFSLFGLVHSVGWLNKDQYYLLGDEGIQIGNTNGTCKTQKEILWSWNYYHWETKMRYNIPSLTKYTQTIHVNNEYVEEEFPTAIFLIENGKINFIFPCVYGGLWYGEVPKEKPLTIRGCLHFFVKHHLVLYLYLILGLFIIYKGKRTSSMV